MEGDTRRFLLLMHNASHSFRVGTGDVGVCTSTALSNGRRYHRATKVELQKVGSMEMPPQESRTKAMMLGYIS